MQVCTCIPNGYCRSSAGTLTGGQYGSKGRGVEPQDGCVARPMRPMETAEVFPCADVLDVTPFNCSLAPPNNGREFTLALLGAQRPGLQAATVLQPSRRPGTLVEKIRDAGLHLYSIRLRPGLCCTPPVVCAVQC